MALVDATQLVEDLLMSTIDSKDVLNFEEIGSVKAWVIDAVESKEDATVLLQHGITCAITAFGMKFIGLRRNPHDQRDNDSSGVQQDGRLARTARHGQALQAAA